MSQRKGVPCKRVFPIERGFYFEFFTEADADEFFRRGMEVGSRIERVDRVTITIKSPRVKSSEAGTGGQGDE